MQNFEISRLTDDPIFGDINHARILNADQEIRQKHALDDPLYKERMKTIKKKIKHPVTEEELALRKEHMKYREAEDLLKKMGSALSEHKMYNAASVSNFNAFDVTTRFDQRAQTQMGLPLKTRSAMSKKKGANTARGQTPADIKNEALKAISMIELLRMRENEIAIEERNLAERKMSNRLTLIRDPDEMHSPKVSANGHFQNT